MKFLRVAITTKQHHLIHVVVCVDVAVENVVHVGIFPVVVCFVHVLEMDAKIQMCLVRCLWFESMPPYN